MHYRFNASGHPDILAAHKTTLEFTKDTEISLNGDCILGIKADFDLDKIKNFIKKSKNRKVTITIKSMPRNKKHKETEETIKAELNPKFNSHKEIVIRKSDFISERTLAIKADKGALDIKTELMEYLKIKNNKIIVVIENKQNKLNLFK